MKAKLISGIAAEASGKYEVSVGGQKIQGTAPATKDYTKFRRTNLPGRTTPIPNAFCTTGK